MKTDDRWQRVEALYHAALARPAGERVKFLRSVCGDDEALYCDVESFLAQPASDVRFLQTPALAVLARDMAMGSGGARLAAYAWSALPSSDFLRWSCAARQGRVASHHDVSGTRRDV
jgi:hypothetical protein